MRVQRGPGELQFHLDGGEKLPDFVVELARDAAALLLLRRDQPRGQPLKVTGMLRVLLAFPPQPILETPRVQNGQQRDGEGGGERTAQPQPPLPLGRPVNRGGGDLVLKERFTIEGPDFVRDRDGGGAAGRDAAGEQVGRRDRGVGVVRVEDFERHGTEGGDLVAQLGDPRRIAIRLHDWKV